ncbi:MAG TPA: COR domain-containing protein [Anaerolineales bacterium]|nr:COR domain-containing protein [Anaerolineales bacterium]
MDEKEVLFWIHKAKLEKWDGLDLSKNRISTLPPEIGQLENLSVLDVSQTGLLEVPPEIGSLRNLRILKLSKNQLSSLPTEIGQLTHLISLDLTHNQLTTLPSEFGQLVELQELALNDNQLRILPDQIGRLISLRRVNLGNEVSGNQLTALPATVGNLINLEQLEIDNNSLTALPPEIKYLSVLHSLGISRNQLTFIPSEVGSLIGLRSLRLSFNQLTKVPHELGKLLNLQELWLNSNKISTLPLELTHIPYLKTLDLTNNPLPIPPEILSRVANPVAIFVYYFGLEKITKKRINQAKLLILGQGSVGKTSLVQRILHSTFDQNQTKTEGISINQWQVEGSQKRDSNSPISNSPVSSLESSIRLNIWDFGGQEIMHATHQFFLTKRSLYLLVLDARLTQEENRVEYWLKIIQSFGGESPVLIVGNKTDQHPLDIDRTGLQKKYPNIVGILETSAATGAGIDALKAEIARQLDTLPHVRDLLPETWFTVKSKLEELGRDKNFITQDEYLGLCATNEVTDETSQHTLISFLHDLGVVLHFQDDPRLEALGILNPQWVTNGVYKILNSHELFQNQGTLTLPLLNKILNLPEYPSNKRLFIVDMMKKFELCYDIEPDKSFLIPDLLPKDEPFTGDWDGALAFQFHYNVLPSSIISRFIVRMNAFVHKTVWRSGVVLKSGGNTALVKADTEDRKICLWVTGGENTRRDFLSAIRMEFDAIHKTIAKIEATEKVPLPSQPGVVPVDYEFLLRLERDNRSTFPVQAGNDILDVDVKELLDGIRPSKNQAKKVFISYAHKDKSFVSKLAGELESQNMKVWWDFDRLKGGQDWQKEIERGIKQCDFFLVALSPDAVASEWVGNEITYATLAQKAIIPLHLKKCDIPIGLVKKQYIDFETQTQKAALKQLLGILQDRI